MTTRRSRRIQTKVENEEEKPDTEMETRKRIKSKFDSSDECDSSVENKFEPKREVETKKRTKSKFDSSDESDSSVENKFEPKREIKKCKIESDDEDKASETTKIISSENRKRRVKKIQSDEDGSSSDSSVGNYLQAADEIDLNDSFFNFEKDEKPPDFATIEKKMFNNIHRISESEDSEIEEKVEINIPESENIEPTTNFTQIKKYNEKLEEAKACVENYQHKKSKKLRKVDTTKLEDINKLLSVGEAKNRESISSQNDFSSEDENDWEEIEVKGKQEVEIPKEGVQITVELPTTVRKKTKGVDLMASIKRRINRIKKENQVYIHKVHLLCWIAHGNFLNSSVLNNEILLGQALSLLPSEKCYPSKHADISYLEKITRWYANMMKLNETSPDNTTPVKEQLNQLINKKTANSKRNFVLLFIIILRSLGLQCRLVLSFQCLPLRVPKTELCSIPNSKPSTSTETSNKTSKSKSASVNTSFKNKTNKSFNDKNNKNDELFDKKLNKNTKLVIKKDKTKKVSLKDELNKNSPEKIEAEASRSSRRLKDNLESTSKAKPLKISNKSELFDKKLDKNTKLVIKSDNERKKISLKDKLNQNSPEKIEVKKLTPIPEAKASRSSMRLKNNLESTSKAKEPLKINTKQSEELFDKKLDKNTKLVIKTNNETKKVSLKEKLEQNSPEKLSKPSRSCRIKDKNLESSKKGLKIPQLDGANDSDSSPEKKDVNSNKKVSKVSSEPKTRIELKKSVSKSSESKKIETRDTNKEKQMKNVKPTKEDRDFESDVSDNFESKPKKPLKGPKARTSLLKSKKTENPDTNKEKQMKNVKATKESSDFDSDVTEDSDNYESKSKKASKGSSISKSKTVGNTNKKMLKTNVKPTKEDPDFNSDVTEDSDYDSDFRSKPEFKKRKPKLKKPDPMRKITVNTKIKRNIPAGKDIDPRALSSDEEYSQDEKRKLGNDIWVEVFLEEEEKWISVDVIKGQVHCVSELYKRASHPVSYIVAWDNNLSVKDITARYCPNWNTVTRKLRVDSKWWTETLKPFLGRKTARDREEDEDLARQQLEQPLPKTINEYKNHPLYALKRHLLKFEAIYPPDAVTLGFIRNEAVYARECVHTLHSREIWVKHAKVVKPGMEPYKIVKARPKYDRSTGNMITDIPLEIFGPWQVEDYVPPTAENGIVPRNPYGNVELFKPCMLPKKTVHLRLPGLNKIARKLRIDCASAVVGFDFHGGSSHPTFDGFVVCEEFKDVLIAAWEEDQEESARKEIEKFEKRVWGNWRKLIKGMLIKERLKARYDFGEPSQEKKKVKPSKPKKLKKDTNN